MTNIGDKIRRAREAVALSQAEMATALGISQAGYAKIENGSTVRSRYLEEVLRFLKLDLEGNPVEAGQGGYKAAPSFLGGRDLPVFSAVEGGPGEMVVSTDPIDMIPRPWFFERVKDAFAVVVIGDSMYPLYEPGDMVLVHPKLPPIRGRDAVFITDNDEFGEFKATIKRLESMNTDVWRVRQFNPLEGQSATFELDRRTWTRAVRVVGKYVGV